MSYRYERYRERPRSALRSWLIFLTTVVWLLVLGCLLLRFVVRPQLTNYFNREVARAINPALPADADPGAALRDSLAQVPVGVAVPPGELVVSEEDANVYIDGYRQQLQGIDDVRVRFTPGQVEFDVTVQGITGTARMRPVVQDGRIVATNASLDQPLGSILSIDELLGAFQERLNAELSAQNRRMTDLRVEQGQAVVIVE